MGPTVRVRYFSPAETHPNMASGKPFTPGLIASNPPDHGSRVSVSADRNFVAVVM
jgi:hypothetical protein